MTSDWKNTEEDQEQETTAEKNAREKCAIDGCDVRSAHPS